MGDARFISRRSANRPRRLAWIALIALPILALGASGCSSESDGAQVNRQVERQYVEHMGITGSVRADCDWVEEVGEEAPEWWVCDILGSPPYGADVCNVDVTRDGNVVAKITYCLGEDFD